MTELKTTDILLSSCLPRDLLETLNGSSFYKNSLPCLCLQQSAVSPLGTSIHLLTVYLSLSTPHGIANKQCYFGEAQSSDMNLVFQLSSISFLSQSCIPDCHLNCLHFCCFVFFSRKNIQQNTVWIICIAIFVLHTPAMLNALKLFVYQPPIDY